MEEFVTQIASAFGNALSSISIEEQQRQIKTRYLAAIGDELENMVDASLLRESVEQVLTQKAFKDGSTILLMDRRGGGKAQKIASSIIELIGKKVKDARFVLVAFVTPHAGVGTLVRSSLVRKGAECGVHVDVVAMNRPAEGFSHSKETTNELLQGADFVITYAPEGTAGLIDINSGNDALVHASDLCVLSFPDPEHAIADIPAFENVVNKRPGFNHVRFTVQSVMDDEFVDVGKCILGDGGDVNDKLWKFIDNAKRNIYQVLAEPIANDVAIGVPLIFPCKRTLENVSQNIEKFKTSKIVQAASDIILVGHR